MDRGACPVIDGERVYIFGVQREVATVANGVSDGTLAMEGGYRGAVLT